MMTYADIWRPRVKAHQMLYDGALVIAGSAWIALWAQLAIPLPFSPVPITGQTLAILMIGALMGRRRGSLAVLAYLGEGLAGWPVFAGGRAGLAHLMGPTGGYLVGFVGAAYLIGWLAERGWARRMWTTLLAMLLGNLIIYVCGLGRLAMLVGVERAFSLGLYPFIIGDLMKMVLAALLLPAGWKLLGQVRGTH